MNLEIIKLTHSGIDDFSDLIKVFEEVFECEYFSSSDRTHLQRFLDNPNFLVFVAKTDNKLVGGLTAHILESCEAKNPSAYIYDLAVLKDLQRQGIGKLLIAFIKDYCQKNDFNELFVQAETNDNQAVNFYRTTDISDELQVAHFTYSFDNNKKTHDSH